MPIPELHGRFLTLLGCRVHYYEVGQGEPVIMLHGAGSPAALRAPARQRSVVVLAQYGLWAIAPDLPGFGESLLPDSMRALQDYPTWLAQFLDILQLERAHVVGTSMGGGIALLFALENPQRVNRIVIVGSTGLRLNQAPIHYSVESRPEEAIRKMFKDSRVADAYLKEGALLNTAEETRAFMKTAQRLSAGGPLDLSNRLSGLRAPTLVVWGEHDRIIPIAHAYEFVKRIPNAELFVVAGSGHLPQIEKIVESHRAIAEFLTRK